MSDAMLAASFVFVGLVLGVLVALVKDGLDI